MDSTQTAVSHLAAQAPLTAAGDERAWQDIQKAHAVDRSIVKLNHAGIGTSPRAVVDAFVRRTWDGETCTPNTIFSYGPQLEPVRKALAGMLGSDPEENCDNPQCDGVSASGPVGCSPSTRRRSPDHDARLLGNAGCTGAAKGARRDCRKQDPDSRTLRQSERDYSGV